MYNKYPATSTWKKIKEFTVISSACTQPIANDSLFYTKK